MRMVGAEHLGEIPDRRRARERHDVDAMLEQHAVNVGLALAFLLGHDGAIRDHFGDLGTLTPELVRDQLAADVGMRQQNSQTLHRS